MNSFFSFFLFFVSVATAFADVPPRSPSATRYKDLYLNSAFTDPPPEEEPEEIISDLPDWVLVGLSKYVDGVKVKLMNKKDRTRVTIPSKSATEMGFSIKEIKQDRNFIKNAVVTLQKGGMTGEVRFDPKFLTLKKASGPASASKNDPRTAGKGTPTPPAAKRDSRVPTPPTPSGGTPPASGNQVPQPTTPATQTNGRGGASPSGNRPSRRPRYPPGGRR
jgi:hypothetical protein